MFLRYVSDQDKSQQMRDKAFLENGGTLGSFPDCYKNQEMCTKAVDNYPHALFGPEFYKIKEMCYKTVHRWGFFWCLILLLINIKLKKYVTYLFLYIYF